MRHKIALSLCNKPHVFVLLSRVDPSDHITEPSGRVVLRVGLRPFTSRNRGFESRRGHEIPVSCECFA